jgi:hypothetical protein
VCAAVLALACRPAGGARVPAVERARDAAPAGGEPSSHARPRLHDPEVEALALPACVLPRVPPEWPVHRLRAGAGTLRLPPGYRLDPPPGADARGAAGADTTIQSWTGPDDGGGVIAPHAAPGGRFMLLPPDGAPLAGVASECTLPLFGHRARVTRYAFARPGARDTLYVGTLDVVAGAGREVGAGAQHRRAAVRDSLLAALTALELGP